MLPAPPPSAASPPASSPPDPIAPPATPGPPPLTPADIAALLARGDDFFRVGKVTAARLAYIQAAEAGDGRAAMRMGTSFDPAFLMQGYVRDTFGDPAEARSWYRRARELGMTEAERRLKRLDQRR